MQVLDGAAIEVIASDVRSAALPVGGADQILPYHVRADRPVGDARLEGGIVEPGDFVQRAPRCRQNGTSGSDFKATIGGNRHEHAR
jgi:hypothetical protein